MQISLRPVSLLVAGGLLAASAACNFLVPGMTPPPRTQPPIMCTPPACAADEVYFCAGECPGGCGTVCATLTPEAPTITPEVTGLTSVMGQQPVAYLQVGTNPLNALAFSPDGRLLAASYGTAGAVLIDLNSQQVTSVVSATPPVTNLVFSPDGRWLLTLTLGQQGRQLELWDISGIEPAPVALPLADALDGDFAPDHPVLAISRDDGTIRLVEITSGQEEMALEAPNTVRGLDFSPDGKSLAGVYGDGSLIIWDLESGSSRTLTHMGLLAAPVASPQFTPDWQKLLWVGRGTAVLIDPETNEELAWFRHEDFITYWAFSPPDGRILATSSAGTIDGDFGPIVTVWDTTVGEKIDTLHGFSGYGMSLALSPDGTLLAVGDKDGNLTLWAVAQ